MSERRTNIYAFPGVFVVANVLPEVWRAASVVVVQVFVDVGVQLTGTVAQFRTEVALEWRLRIIQGRTVGL